MERSEIRTLIQSVLREELGKLRIKNTKRQSTRQEHVRIANDQDLSVFVKRLATLCRDEQMRHDIAEGALSFRLDDGTLSTSGAERSPAEGAHSGKSAGFEKGFINERQIDALDEDTKVVVISKAVRFTPLAKDRLRQRGIRIERKAS